MLSSREVLDWNIMIRSALIKKQRHKGIHIPNINQSCIPCARNHVDFIHLLYQHSQECGSHSKLHIVLLLVVLNESLIRQKLMWLYESSRGNHTWLCANSRNYHSIKRCLRQLLLLCLWTTVFPVMRTIWFQYSSLFH